MTYMYKTVATYNITIFMNQNMLKNYYVYIQQPTCLMEFRCNSYFMPFIAFQSFVPQ